MEHAFKDAFEKMVTPYFDKQEIEWWFVCTCFDKHIVDYMANDQETYGLTNQEFMEKYAELHKLVHGEDFLSKMEDEWLEYKVEGLLEPLYL